MKSKILLVALTLSIMPLAQAQQITQTTSDEKKRAETPKGEMGIFPSAEVKGNNIFIQSHVSKEKISLFYDPQTAGGLLISVAPNHAKALLTCLRENYPNAAIIGRVVERKPFAIVVT